MNDVAALIPDSPLASDAEAAADIARLGAIGHELARVETRKSEAVAAATKAAEDKATPLLAEKAALEKRVEAYCVAERARLTKKGETKTVEFSTGAVSWRTGVETVEFDRTLKKNILLALRKIPGFLKRFTVTKVELSKTKMKAAIDTERAKLAKIRGVTFVPPGESFSIQPAGAELAARPEAAAASDG
jgi:phage host-nuclease inhibitor protein Gam